MLKLLIDSHIHVGQYYDLYFSPRYIVRLMDSLGVEKYAVSSTSICEENYGKVLEEIHDMTALSNGKALPVLWITPLMILSGQVEAFLHSGIQWKYLKAHPQLCPELWTADSIYFDFVLTLSRETGLPLLIHTGEKTGCEASRFSSVIERNRDINFILAHGRPSHEAMDLLNQYGNVWIDTAFVEIKEIAGFLQNGFSDRILWGTDLCIPKYFYPTEDMLKYYKDKLDAFREVSSPEQFEQVTFKNAMKLFNL